MPGANFLSLPIATVEVAKEAPSLTYGLDLDRGRIIGRIDGIEAVRQSIRKRLITPRFKCLIYGNQYGSELEQAYIVDGATEDYIDATIDAYVNDALAPDSRILSSHDFSVTQENEKVYIFFICDTIFGEIRVEEVI